jgi:predicted nucleic acid-binding protein
MSTTFCDAGPMVALIIVGEPDHQRVLQVLDTLPNQPLLTTWACLTEAMYLVGKEGGHPAQELLWKYFENGVFTLHIMTHEERSRIQQLMQKYADLPMDHADATLVSAAESLNLKKILTFDRHFHAYRINDRVPFDVIL